MPSVVTCAPYPLGDGHTALPAAKGSLGSLAAIPRGEPAHWKGLQQAQKPLRRNCLGTGGPIPEQRGPMRAESASGCPLGLIPGRTELDNAANGSHTLVGAVFSSAGLRRSSPIKANRSRGRDAKPWVSLGRSPGRRRRTFFYSSSSSVRLDAGGRAGTSVLSESLARLLSGRNLSVRGTTRAERPE
jgi:hypothetical protein